MKEELIGFKVTKQEKEMLLALAETQGTTISGYIRAKILSKELQPDFLQSLFLFGMYIDAEIGNLAYSEIDAMVISFRASMLKLNRDQKRIASILVATLEEIKADLEYDPNDSIRLEDPFKDNTGNNFHDIVWEHFLTLGKESIHG